MCERLVYMIICVFLIFSFGCENKEKKNMEYISLRELIRLPQDSLTDQQKEIKQKLIDVQVCDIVVEDNKLTLKLDELDFEKKSIPVVYYNQLIDELNETNRGVEKMKIQNLDSIYKLSMDNYLKNKENWFR